MAEQYSLQDIIEHIDQLIEMMEEHEEQLYGAIDIVYQVKEEVRHISPEPDDE